MTYKQLTVNDVESVAEFLLSENGQVTTLEIKNELREDGFYAVQEAVAKSMYFLWRPRQWHFTFNGTYRTYFPDFESAEEAYIAAKPGEVHQTSWHGWLDASYYMAYYGIDDPADEPVDPVTLPYKAPVVAVIDKAWAGDWTVYDYRQIKPAVFMSCDADDYEEARVAVRTHYSRNWDVAREHVGASRVKGDNAS
jgi:hypothetical protein